MGVHGRRSAWRVAFCLLGALSVAVPSGAAGDDVPGAVLLVELETRATARVGVTYRQVRALATEEDRLVGDRLVLEAGGPDFESELLPGRRVAAGTASTLAVPVPQDLPAWRGVDGRRDETLFGDCVVIAVDGRRSVVVVNEPPTDGERLGAGSPRARVGDGLVAAFERACPAERAADRRSVQRAVLGRYFNAGSGVRARVSKREVRDLRLPDQVPGSPFGGGRHVVVGPVDDAGSPLLTEACHQASGVWMDSRPVYVCGSGWFAGVPDGFALLDSEGKALAVATRSSDAPFASLKLSRSEWKPLVLPGALRLADVGFCYGGEAAGRNGCLELAARPSRGGGFEIRLSEAWTEPIEVAVRNARLGPFDLRVRPEDPTARPQLELTWSRPKVRCLGVGAANDVACEAIVRADGFDDYLWAWANHARDCGEIVPDYAAPSSVCPRLSQDGRAIEIEDASVRWLRFGLRVSTARTRETEPAAFWTLRVAGAGDGPAAGAAAAGSGLHLDRRGTVEAFRLASLLGAREEATIVAHAAGSRFVGYGPVALGVLREALQRPVRDGSPFALRAAASPAPLSIALTPDLTKRFAPLLEIETRDGAVVRAIGEVDRFGAEPDRVEDGRAGGGGALGAPSILTVRPRGLSAHRRLPIERSALRPVIDALRQPEELERCLALHAAFAAGAAEAGGPSPPGVDLYAPEGPVALRWRDGDGRWRVSVPATSDLSTAFRSAPEAPRDGLQIWRAGEGWRDFADRDACTAPPPPASSQTAYILLVAEDFDRTRPRAAAATGRRDDVTAFRARWSYRADALRDVLRDRGFTRVELMVVDADPRGRPRFRPMAAVRSLEDDEALAFRRLQEPLSTGGAGGAYRLDDRHPRALRRAFLESGVEDLDPFATLLLLEDPHGEERMGVVYDGHVAKLRVIAGYLGRAGGFVDLVAAAVSPARGASR